MLTSRDDCSSVGASHSEQSSDLSSNGQPMEVTPIDDTSQQSSETTVERKSSFQLSLPSGDTLTISLDTHCEYETQCLPEFFDGLSKGKSAESYVKIRNHFINHWLTVRPKRFGYHEMLRKVGHLHLGKGGKA